MKEQQLIEQLTFIYDLYEGNPPCHLVLDRVAECYPSWMTWIGGQPVYHCNGDKDEQTWWYFQRLQSYFNISPVEQELYEANPVLRLIPYIRFVSGLWAHPEGAQYLLSRYNTDIKEYLCLFPSFFLIFCILTLLGIGVFFCNAHITIGKPLSYQVGIPCIFILGFLGLLLIEAESFQFTAFGNSIHQDVVAYYVNLLILIGSIGACSIWLVYTLDHEILDFELFVLGLLVVLGSFMIVQSNDFLSLYIGIELQSLCLYVMAGSKVRSTFSTEAGVKYFVLGGLASSLFLFGVSLVYGFTGILNFSDLKLAFCESIGSLQESGVLIGFFFIFSGLILKVGGAPFHLWVPDVYEGSPTGITGFFAIVPKLAIFCIIIKLCSLNIFSASPELLNLFLYSGVLSIAVGSLGAIAQTSVKRLLSYSAISQTGFMLYGISSNTIEGQVSVLFYLIIYIIVLINIFLVLISSSLHLNNSSIKLIGNLRYLFRSNPILAYSLMLSIFSIAGIPPLSGFFSKFFIFFSALSVYSYASAVLCIFLSVVGAVYYLKVIRSLMFVRNMHQWIFFAPVRRVSAYLIVYTALFNILFCFFGFDLLEEVYVTVLEGVVGYPDESEVDYYIRLMDMGYFKEMGHSYSDSLFDLRSSVGPIDHPDEFDLRLPFINPFEEFFKKYFS